MTALFDHIILDKYQIMLNNTDIKRETMEKLWYPGEVRTSRGLVKANGRDIKFCTAKPLVSQMV